jgi:hypothetical protein
VRLERQSARTKVPQTEQAVTLFIAIHIGQAAGVERHARPAAEEFQGANPLVINTGMQPLAQDTVPFSVKPIQ